MIVMFCGHSDFYEREEYEVKVIEILKQIVGNAAAEIYLGGYGGFDSFAFECCKKYKAINPNIIIILVTPYLLTNKNTEINMGYDSILFPEIEQKPKKFAICYRNKYMVDKSDYIISFVCRNYGGAYQAYRYAIKKGKRVINIFNN